MANASDIYTGERFLSDIKNGLSGAYLLYGDEDYLKSVALERIRKKIIAFPEFEVFNRSVISFSGGNSSSREEAISKIVEASDGMPMMQEQRLIEICDIEMKSLSQDQLKRFIAAVSDTVISGDTVTVVICRASELENIYNLEKTAMFKKLAEAFKTVKFDVLQRGKLISFIKKRFPQDVLLTDEAAGCLCDMCADGMYACAGESDKLCAYAEQTGKKRIEEEDVKAVCAQSPKDESPFAMADAAQRWKFGEMMGVINDCFDMREEPIAILAKLSRIYTDMLIIKCLYSEGNSSAAIAGKIKMNEYRVKKYISAVDRVPIKIIENAILLSYEADVTLKSTQNDAKTVLETLIARIYTPKGLMTPNA